MSSERWRQIEDLYHAALERDPGRRAGFLAEACRDDEELRREVESLLAQDGVPAPKHAGGRVSNRSHSRAGRHGGGLSRA